MTRRAGATAADALGITVMPSRKDGSLSTKTSVGCSYPTTVVGLDNKPQDLEIFVAIKTNKKRIEATAVALADSQVPIPIPNLANVAKLVPEHMSTSVSPPVVVGPIVVVLSGSTGFWINSPHGVTPDKVEALARAVVKAIGH